MAIARRATALKHKIDFFIGMGPRSVSVGPSLHALLKPSDSAAASDLSNDIQCYGGCHLGACTNNPVPNWCYPLSLPRILLPVLQPLHGYEKLFTNFTIRRERFGTEQDPLYLIRFYKASRLETA